MIPCGQVHLVRDGDLRLHGGLSKKDRSTLPRVCRTARRDRLRSEVSTYANGKTHKSLFNNNLWQSFVADLKVSLPERQRGNDANTPTLLGGYAPIWARLTRPRKSGTRLARTVPGEEAAQRAHGEKRHRPFCWSNGVLHDTGVSGWPGVAGQRTAQASAAYQGRRTSDARGGLVRQVLAACAVPRWSTPRLASAGVIAVTSCQAKSSS
jgi:hypothetical protein